MRKFIFTTIIGFALMVNSALAVTFNTNNGTGSVTNAEMTAAFGWTTPKPWTVAFTCHKIEKYKATVQYTNTMGNTVSQIITVPITTYQSVKRKPSALGFDFVGYGEPLTLNRIPVVGDNYPIQYAGKTTNAKVLSITATPVQTDYSVLGFDGFSYKLFY